MTRSKFKVTPFDRTGKLTTTLYLFTGMWWAVLLFLFAPRDYLVSPEGITIRALVTSYVIPKCKIKRVEIVEDVKPGVGLTWLAGFCGYAGLFAMADGSTAKVYATRLDRMVRILTTGGGPYLLSPAEPEAFVEEVNRVILAQPELREG
ncbi:PH domain-containing protein [Desulfofundulus australicus DSM 11792]|uniref:PH domain-containing protein n=1 Tax=Desulfofundulus australicus DSM 11792 TaxID=1121425 RepID=A0A1M5DWE6_9FIRM|nr:PH domain-containing protein [Desulfofundulus australicus]SHF71269.1 PH domain-containing protein [Desulfofundulus australicus DSM 11792]